MKKEARGALITLSAGVLWGTTGTVGQYMFAAQGLNTQWFMPIRLCAAGLLMFFFCRARYGSAVFDPWKDACEALSLLVYALPGVALNHYALWRTIQLASAGVAVTIQDSSPALILIVMCLITRRWPKIREIAGVILAVTGVFLLTTHGNLSALAISKKALFFGLLSIVTMTVYHIAPRKLLEKYPAVVLQMWAFLLGGVTSMIVFRPWRIDYHPAGMAWFGLLYLMLIGNIAAYTLYLTGVGIVGPEKASLYAIMEPLSTTVFSIIFLATPFTGADFLGMLCVFVMIFLITYVRPGLSPSSPAPGRPR